MNKEQIMNYIETHTISEYDFSRVLGEFINDRDVVMAVIEKNPSNYKILSEELRNDPEILQTALKSVGVFSRNPIDYALPGALTKDNIFLAIDKDALSDYRIREKFSQLLSDKEIMMHFIQTKGIELYRYLPGQLRGDPEVLNAVLQRKRGGFNNPMVYALPGALTKENIFLAIDNEVLSDYRIREDFPQYLSDKEIMMHFIQTKGTDIYTNLSEKLRNDPEVLNAVLQRKRGGGAWNNPMDYAFPGALTKENIFLAIDNEVLSDYRIREDFPQYLSDKELMMHFIQTKGTDIYTNLSEELRNDPEVLNAVLQRKRGGYYPNPMDYALPGALTKDNIFLAIDNDVIQRFKIKEKFPQYLADKDIMMYFIQKKDVDIYQNLSEELRNDPEVLKAVIEHTRSTTGSQIEYALPGAITNETIDLMISNNIYPNTPNLLNNKYYVLRAIERKPQILEKVSDELKKDADIQRLSLVFNPDFLNTIGANSLTEYMMSYAKEYGLEINENNIIEIILSDEQFIKRILSSSPKVYTLLSEERKKDMDNINIILSVNGNNLVYVPNDFITDDMIEMALRNGYSLSYKHYQIMIPFFKKKVQEQPSSIFSYFINSNDTGMTLLLLQTFAMENIPLIPEVEEKMNKIIESYIQKFKNAGIEEQYINNLIQKIKNGEVCALNLLCISDSQGFEDLMYAANLGNLFPDIETRQKYPMRMKPFFANSASFDMYTKTNTKQYKKIKQQILDMGLGDFDASDIALMGYSSIGFARMQELLSGKYGPIDADKLAHLFSGLDCGEVIFEPDGKSFKPIINEQLINLLFGSNYKVGNTPIRNFLNGFGEMEEYIKKEIEKIQSNTDLSGEDKKQRINELNSSFNKYCSSVRDFIKNFNFIFNNWDIIEEEFLKKQSVSKLKIKLNITQVNEIAANIQEVRKTIKTKKARKGFSEKQQSRYRRIPGYEPRDYPLIQSDVFDYVGIQNQYTANPQQAPARAVQLSRMMENKTTKKIPNVNLDYGSYNIKIFNPQDRNLISGGYRSGCCFRPNGNADNSGKNNSLLTYCCSTEYGSGIEIKDSNGKTLMFSPVLRNGNVLMIHSFETIGLTEHEKDIANALLYDWAEEVIKVSQQEEQEQGIVAVTMTDLHPEFDTSKAKAVLTGDKQFRIYNPDHHFDEMYNNLAGNNHHVLAFATNKNMRDIVYDQEVQKSYQYPNLIDIKTVSVSPEQLEVIGQIRDNKNKIIALANKRKEYLQEKQQEQAFEMIKAISELRKTNLILQRNLYAMNPNAKKDILSDYIDGVEMANQVCDELKITRKAETHGFSQIFYSEGWYLGIAQDGKLYGDCIKGFEPQFMSALADIKKNYGLELEYEIDNNSNYIKPGNGGLRV